MTHEIIKRKLKKMLEGRDPAHDFYHIMRVYKNAELIGLHEGSNMEILLTAVLLHMILLYTQREATGPSSLQTKALTWQKTYC
jgi:uncharacterized protein